MSIQHVSLALAFALSACSGPSASAPPSSTAEPPSSPPTEATASAPSAPSAASVSSAAPSSPTTARGTLTVTEKRAGKRNYTEGSIPFAKVAQGTTVVAEEKLDAGTVTFSLTPGSYVLTTYQRPCDGNCGNLDPPADVCTAPVEIAAGATVHATSTVRYGEGCSIKTE